IRLAAAIYQAQRITQVIRIETVAFATGQYSAFGTRLECGEKRTQVSEHQHIRVEAEVVSRVNHSCHRIEQRLAHRIQLRPRVTANSHRAVLVYHTLAGLIPVEHEYQKQGVLASTIGIQRPKHVIQKALESRRDDRSYAPLRARQIAGHNHFGSSQTVEQTG